MRSEKEIREEINRLLILEKEAVADMEEIIKEENCMDYLDIYIQKANAIQSQRITLEWVLNENKPIKE